MKFCPKCGKEMEPTSTSRNAYWCRNCNTVLEKRWVLLHIDEIVFEGEQK